MTYYKYFLPSLAGGNLRTGSAKFPPYKIVLSEDVRLFFCPQNKKEEKKSKGTVDDKTLVKIRATLRTLTLLGPMANLPPKKFKKLHLQGDIFEIKEWGFRLFIWFTETTDNVKVIIVRCHLVKRRDGLTSDQEKWLQKLYKDFEKETIKWTGLPNC